MTAQYAALIIGGIEITKPTHVLFVGATGSIGRLAVAESPAQTDLAPLFEGLEPDAAGSFDGVHDEANFPLSSSPNAHSGISTQSSHRADQRSYDDRAAETMNVRKALSVCLCITALALGGCGSTPSAKPESSRQTVTNSSKGSSMVVVYFSRAGENYGVGNVKVGNTAKLAGAITEETGAPLIEITRNEPYPESYDEATSVAQDEQRDNARPQITLNGDADALGSADTIFLGYPIWWGDAPMPVYTFLEGHDWAGKTIYPFCTHEGSGLGSTPNNITDATGAIMKTGLAVRGTDAQKNADKTAKAVSEWIAKAGL